MVHMRYAQGALQPTPIHPSANSRQGGAVWRPLFPREQIRATGSTNTCFGAPLGLGTYAHSTAFPQVGPGLRQVQVPLGHHLGPGPVGTQEVVPVCHPIWEQRGITLAAQVGLAQRVDSGAPRQVLDVILRTLGPEHCSSCSYSSPAARLGGSRCTRRHRAPNHLGIVTAEVPVPPRQRSGSGPQRQLPSAPMLQWRGEAPNSSTPITGRSRLTKSGVTNSFLRKSLPSALPIAAMMMP